MNDKLKIFNELLKIYIPRDMRGNNGHVYKIRDTKIYHKAKTIGGKNILLPINQRH